MGLQRMALKAAAKAMRRAANEGFVCLHYILAADSVALWAHHSRPQLMEHCEGGLVTRHAELPLELQCRLTGRLRDHQIRAPEPDR